MGKSQAYLPGVTLANLSQVVYLNNPAEVAELFVAALAGPFQGSFQQIVFAVLDHSPEGCIISPLYTSLGADRRSERLYHTRNHFGDRHFR